MVDNILKYEKNSDDDYYSLLGCDELSTVKFLNGYVNEKLEKVFFRRNK